MNDIVKNIRDMFIKEASESPLLFIDLANMERYVSESYSGRSLIELLQNADDAMTYMCRVWREGKLPFSFLKRKNELRIGIKNRM